MANPPNLATLAQFENHGVLNASEYFFATTKNHLLFSTSRFTQQQFRAFFPVASDASVFMRRCRRTQLQHYYMDQLKKHLKFWAKK